MKRTGRQMKRSGRQMKGSGRQASREPDHKHRAWETNEKNWETNKRKWETSRPGTRPDHPATRRPFFKALRTPNSKLFGEKGSQRPARRAETHLNHSAQRVFVVHTHPVSFGITNASKKVTGEPNPTSEGQILLSFGSVYRQRLSLKALESGIPTPTPSMRLVLILFQVTSQHHPLVVKQHRHPWYPFLCTSNILVVTKHTHWKGQFT